MFPISIIAAAASVAARHSSEQSNEMFRRHMQDQEKAYARSDLANKHGSLLTGFAREQFMTSRLREWAEAETKHQALPDPTEPVAVHETRPLVFDASTWTGR